MIFKSATIIFFVCIVSSSCNKPSEDLNSAIEAPTTQATFAETNTSDNDKLILVDASRDGGVWWFPQASKFSASLPHQGKALADYLRSKGFEVDELPRGTTITWNLLKKYRKIIRAAGFGNYTSTEISAYDSSVLHSSSILFLSDHLQNFPNDKLSAHLGLNFSGSHTGTITPTSNHPTTEAVSSISYIAGSVINQPDPAWMTILGYVGKTATQPGYAAMGILHHPKAKIFFIGDVNGIEQIPQPFTNNLVTWLFE